MTSTERSQEHQSELRFEHISGCKIAFKLTVASSIMQQSL